MILRYDKSEISVLKLESIIYPETLCKLMCDLYQIMARPQAGVSKLPRKYRRQVSAQLDRSSVRPKVVNYIWTNE